jgi:hypothetical protein
LKKIIKKNKKEIKNIIKKNHVGKHYSNSQCFVKKATAVIFNQFIIKKKWTKIILKKIIKKPCGETL